LRVVSIEWTMGKDPDVLVEVFNTEALIEAVLEALLEDPKAMARAMSVLRGGK